jgi:DNA-binding NtrC family response regulator
MGESVLNGKRILAVDDEADILASLEEVIMDSCPSCTFDKASTFEEAVKLLQGNQYDVVVLDIMGVRGFDLLDIAVKRNFKVAMLTAHAMTPEALKKSYEMKAHAYLPKEMIVEIVPFLEDILTYDFATGWRRLLQKLSGFLNDTFEMEWEKKTGMNWREWGK